jgi:TolA-binding protein
LASSTLKIGQTYSKLKDNEKARMMFERVVDQYPDSPEAEVARKALEIEADKIEPEKPEPSSVSAVPTE